MNISRKDFIASGTKYAAGAVIGAVAADTLMNKAMAGVNAAWPFPYQALDVEKVRILGHDLYYDATYGGCCYGAFAALVNASAAITGEPFTSFPSGLMLWGGGGGTSWDERAVRWPDQRRSSLSSLLKPIILLWRARYLDGTHRRNSPRTSATSTEFSLNTFKTNTLRL